MPEGHIRSFGPYQLDLRKEQLRRDTQPVRLTPKAFQVLRYVVERRGQLVTKEELFRVLWADTVVGDAALTMCIQEIRKALQDNPKSPQYLETAQRAVALNASLSAAHVALGVAALLNKHYAQAEAEVEQVLVLNPGSADLYASAASILNWVGRPAEAVGLMEQALHLNPRLPSWYFLFIGQAYYLLGRTAEAIEPLQRILKVYPHRIDTHLLLAAVYSELGKEAEARAEVEEVLRLNPQFLLEVHKERAPIKDPATLERHIAALRKAGLE